MINKSELPSLLHKGVDIAPQLTHSRASPAKKSGPLKDNKLI